jgi:hypothetical protein
MHDIEVRGQFDGANKGHGSWLRGALWARCLSDIGLSTMCSIFEATDIYNHRPIVLSSCRCRSRKRNHRSRGCFARDWLGVLILFLECHDSVSESPIGKASSHGP